MMEAKARGGSVSWDQAVGCWQPARVLHAQHSGGTSSGLSLMGRDVVPYTQGWGLLTRMPWDLY